MLLMYILKDIFSQLSELNVPHIDTEMTILSNLTLVYRALPIQQPDHPLRFPDECITTAREALQLHQRLCLLFFARSDHSIRMYIDWYVLIPILLHSLDPNN